MQGPSAHERRVLEIALILVCIGLACLLYVMQGYKMVILNLFFLPVVLGAFFLGRYRAGVLALFSAVSASLVVVLTLPSIITVSSPLVIALAVIVWAASLGLTAMLVGTLSDDRATKVKELHEAYVGVIEVLAQYLQSAHPRLKNQSIRVAELSQRVAATMGLSPRQLDDIRVAALLYDMGHIEVTTKVIRRAVGTFEVGTVPNEKRTFQGMDLMLSLGNVLSGAVPLLLNQDHEAETDTAIERTPDATEIPVGARIIRAVRAYLSLTSDESDGPRRSPDEALEQLRNDRGAAHDPAVLEVLGRCVSQSPCPETHELAEPVNA